jgi:hypothetical protein
MFQIHLDKQMDEHKLALSHQRTCWSTGQLCDVEGDVALGHINEHSLLLAICNIVYLVAS